MLFSNLKIVTLLISLLPLNIKPYVHPLHVTTTEFNYNLKEQSVEITTAIFTDDFEDILRRNYKQKVDLINPSMHSKMDKLVESYLKGHLICKVNGKEAALNYIGFELDKEAVNVYLEIPKTNAFNSIEISNALLYDLFDDQMSIMHIVKNGKRQSTKLIYPDRNFTVKF